MPTLPISDRSQLSYLTPVSNLQSPCLCGFSKFFWRQDVKQTGQEMSLVLRPLLCLGYIGEVSGGYKQCTVFPCKWGSVRTEDTDKLPLSTYNHHLGVFFLTLKLPPFLVTAMTWRFHFSLLASASQNSKASCFHCIPNMYQALFTEVIYLSTILTSFIQHPRLAVGCPPMWICQQYILCLKSLTLHYPHLYISTHLFLSSPESMTVIHKLQDIVWCSVSMCLYKCIYA